jgi:hypothetical protein
MYEHPLGPDAMAAMLAIIAATPTGLPNLHTRRRPITGAGIGGHHLAKQRDLEAANIRPR